MRHSCRNTKAPSAQFLLPQPWSNHFKFGNLHPLRKRMWTKSLQEYLCMKDFQLLTQFGCKSLQIPGTDWISWLELNENLTVILRWKNFFLKVYKKSLLLHKHTEPESFFPWYNQPDVVSRWLAILELPVEPGVGAIHRLCVKLCEPRDGKENSPQIKVNVILDIQVGEDPQILVIWSAAKFVGIIFCQWSGKLFVIWVSNLPVSRVGIRCVHERGLTTTN